MNHPTLSWHKCSVDQGNCNEVMYLSNLGAIISRNTGSSFSPTNKCETIKTLTHNTIYKFTLHCNQHQPKTTRKCQAIDVWHQSGQNSIDRWICSEPKEDCTKANRAHQWFLLPVCLEWYIMSLYTTGLYPIVHTYLNFCNMQQFKNNNLSANSPHFLDEFLLDENL